MHEEEEKEEKDEEVTSKGADQKKEEGLFKADREEEHAGCDECLWQNERVFVCLECTLLQQLLSYEKNQKASYRKRHK